MIELLAGLILSGPILNAPILNAPGVGCTYENPAPTIHQSDLHRLRISGQQLQGEHHQLQSGAGHTGYVEPGRLHAENRLSH